MSCRCDCEPWSTTDVSGGGPATLPVVVWNGSPFSVYALADLIVRTRDEHKEVIAAEVIEALSTHLACLPAVTGGTA